MTMWIATFTNPKNNICKY